MTKQKEGSSILTPAILSGMFVLLSACIGGIFMILNTVVDKSFTNKVSTPQFGGLATQPAFAPVAENTVAPRGGALFQDDFSDPQSGWPPSSRDEKKFAGYSDGRYVIQVFTGSLDVWANPGLNYQDVRIEVDATKFGGTEDNSFGVICRYQDHDNFYYFLVSSDGYQVIGKYQGGENYYLSSEQMQSTDAILTGGASNHLRADCTGSALTLYDNGRQLSSVTDTAFGSGDVGLMVGTFDQPNVSVMFDNFVVYAP